MEIKEVEKLLSVSRSNIRFYEKVGLLNPARHENNYRNSSEEDIDALKKILVLRKLGFSVEEISEMQKGTVSFDDAITENISRLEKEINSLKGALKISKTLAEENITYEELDQNQLWNEIAQSEKSGQNFTDIYKDYLGFELNIFENMLQYVFGHNFRKSRKKHGIPIALGIVLIILLIRGISCVVIWNQPFIESFTYPLIIFAVASAVMLPLYILNKFSAKAANITAKIITVVGLIFLSACILILIYGIIKMIIQK